MPIGLSNLSPRQRLIVDGILFLVLMVLVVVVDLNQKHTEPQEKPIQPASVSTLAYCHEEQDGLCVVSFDIDDDGNMLVNILLDDLSYPRFMLQVLRDGLSIPYECRNSEASFYHVVCIGPQMPPGGVLHFILISTRDESILAEGDLSIIGLGFPTLGVVTVTPFPTATTTPNATESITPVPTSTNSVSYP